MRNLTNTATNVVQAYNDIMRYRKYFGTQGNGTSTIPATKFSLFNNKVGDTDKNISTGATVTLKDADTSLFGQGGTIPNAESFTVVSIGADIRKYNVQATSEFVDDTVTSINITPVSTVNPAPLFENLRTQCSFELYRNSTDLLEQGNLEDYPSGLFVDGWGGESTVVPAVTQGTAAGLQVTYTKNGVTMMQNGNQWRKLAVEQVLAALDEFHGRLVFSREIALASSLLCGHIDILLRGFATVNYKGQQFTAFN